MAVKLGSAARFIDQARSVAYGDAHHLSGRDVIVVGAGASAMDIAALLRARGATPSVMTRRQGIRFQSPLGARSVYEKIVAPMTPLGPGWKSVLCVRAPMVFHAMPEAFRVDVVRRYLGPAPAWFVREQIEGHVPYITGSSVAEASVKDGRVRLLIRQAEGQTREVFADHVVAAFQVGLGQCQAHAARCAGDDHGARCFAHDAFLSGWVGRRLRFDGGAQRVVHGNHYRQRPGKEKDVS